MFALSPLVSHLIPDSRLPPFEARLSEAELVFMAKEDENGKQFKQYFGAATGLGGSF